MKSALYFRDWKPLLRERVRVSIVDFDFDFEVAIFEGFCVYKGFRKIAESLFDLKKN